MKFAHMADIHLGAVSDPRMKELEASTLQRAFDICEERGVDFVIIAGDVFHINIPDLAVVREAVTVFKRFTDTGRRIYVVYGSHDFSPNSTSIIDILEAAGILVRVGKPSSSDDGRLRPEVVTDPRTGSKITGISGRRASLEREAFEDLDREYLKAIEGFKVFVFHTGLLEMRKEGEKFEGISQSSLPDGFDYYAGGHIHRVYKDSSGRVVFPGPLFTGWGADLEATIRGTDRGFFIVEAERVGSPRLEFVPLKPFEGVHKEIDAGGKTAEELNEILREWATEEEVKGKVVLLKVHGELSSGRTSDVDFGLVREMLAESGALYLHLNRSGLRTKEMSAVTVVGESAEEIERKVFKEMAGTVRGRGGEAMGDEPALAARLLSALRNPKLEGESQEDYLSRVDAETREILGLTPAGGAEGAGSCGATGGERCSDGGEKTLGGGFPQAQPNRRGAK